MSLHEFYNGFALKACLRVDIRFLGSSPNVFKAKYFFACQGFSIPPNVSSVATQVSVALCTVSIKYRGFSVCGLCFLFGMKKYRKIQVGRTEPSLMSLYLFFIHQISCSFIHKRQISQSNPITDPSVIFVSYFCTNPNLNI